jgi:hypothetical protein
MQIELMAIHHVLSGWLKTPDAPICQLSLAYGEKRMRPCLPEEIQRMREFMKRYNWMSYMRLFYGDGKISIWEPSWPRKYEPQMVFELLKPSASISQN